MWMSSFSSTQFGKAQFDVNERFFGTRGSSSSPYSGPLGIWGEEKWLWGGGADKPAADGQFSASGSFSDNLAQADSEKQKAFISSISSGKFHNQAALGRGVGVDGDAGPAGRLRRPRADVG